MARSSRYTWMAVALALAGAAISAAWGVGRTVAPGPWLEAVQQRGTLVVGVRQYARPAPPKAPTPPEPDHFDVAMARFVADRLGVQLQVRGLPGEPGSPAWQAAQREVDIVIAGATNAGSKLQPVTSAYAVGDGSLLVLRGSRYQRSQDLRGQPVCVGQGSAYATRIAQDFDGVPKVYASSIRAASGFLAGECQALADDAPVIARLQTLPEWRFYRTVDGAVQADGEAARIGLQAADPQSAAWFDHAVRDWRHDGALERARTQRAGDVAYEASQLQDGLVCHS
ncbi:transporter substrate-binding domain-containing protein [Cupriavidus pauculus]|uniref:transporter substrate-binding domain-containing protein n=1 Tax=Cupriavidus pauculus TaxID=82633 RepID=UPI001EE1F99C|nr:transporter substrate-binding domain-containing protein [Cupriavidus pauculus]GJG96934.1 transporter substrate-binding domain-containing protein [Cupriavidus pauculus]